MDTPETLLQTLTLERIEVNLFRGHSEQKTGRLFGGQVIAQSLMAAYGTVEDRLCHSLHGYFIRPGDATIPILFEVDRSRDGGSFTTRRVTAIQHGQQIFNFAASFQAPETGLEHQGPMPQAAGPDGLPDIQVLQHRFMEPTAGASSALFTRTRPIELRPADGNPFSGEIGPPVCKSWMRAPFEIGDDPRMQQVIMTYASDMNLLSTSMRPHGVHWLTPGLQPASLDHAMWFHRPTDFSQWHLYSHDSPSASGGRGLVRGEIHAQDGRLVASVVQEGLIRIRTPKAD